MENNDAVNTTLETGVEEGTDDTVSLSKTEYEELISVKSAYGNLKREVKDIRKSLEQKPEAPQPSETKAGLIEKTFLRSAGITDKEEIALALETAKKWGVDIDEVVDDPDFQSKIERHRTTKANLEATTGIRGDKTGTTSAKNESSYWVAKGTPPSREDVPDDAVRRKILRDIMKSSKSKPKFYNQ